MPGTDTPAPEAHTKLKYAIIVDGTQHEVASNEVGYIVVVDFAYPGQANDPQYKFTVTFRHAVGPKHQGTLRPGETVHVKKEGTVFNVTRTTKS